MNEISICESCINKCNITLCRACCNYDIINKGFQNFYVDENEKAENLQIRDGQFFSIKELNENIVFLIRNNYGNNEVIQIPLNLGQVNIIQKHLWKVLKTSGFRK